MGIKNLKSKVVIAGTILMAGMAFYSFKPATSAMPGAEGVKWMDWDMAVKLNKEHPKKIFIDVYTQWCGWCKRMDATTYQDTGIINYINKYFYAVRLDAETKDTFHFNNHAFVNPHPETHGSVNELAYSLLNGSMSYPTTVYMDQSFNRITYAPGYLSAGDLKIVLTFISEDKYKTETYQAYRQSLTDTTKRN